jgi:CRISPR-associated endonuclease/helicase Cas3
MWNPIDITPYRHEFGSLLDAQRETAFQEMNDASKDLSLHLIAAHHGYARPHFPAECVLDCKSEGRNLNEIAVAVSTRFARLQREYGRWGLAYLESLLRAADWAASAEASEVKS